MKALVTLNLNDYLCDNVRRSHVAAAQRWGMEYVECGEPREGDVFKIKHQICAALDGFERCAWVDADAVIHEDCPNWPGLHDDFLAVAGLTEAGAENAREHWRRVETFTGPVPFPDGTYVNGGVFAWTPSKHREVFAQTARILNGLGVWDRGTGERIPHAAMLEQTVFNMVLATTPIEVGILPFDFNRTDGEPGFIMHLAGGDHAAKRRALELIEWKGVPV